MAINEANRPQNQISYKGLKENKFEISKIEQLRRRNRLGREAIALRLRRRGSTDASQRVGAGRVSDITLAYRLEVVALRRAGGKIVGEGTRAGAKPRIGDEHHVLGGEAQAVGAGRGLRGETPPSPPAVTGQSQLELVRDL
ncbi:unnamed protein product [Pieris macdunnoughi]|uniref:Uncharacterized protein n=1 Tax=Pieris macdunnoughi TaxID=345717 RepID=A0A821XMK7_9NEOP|nr:unnamed protein product [Pieris macdunnoughi]